MEKIEKAILKIIADEKELEEFLKQKTKDEMYSFLLKEDNTITREEFDEKVEKILKEYVSLVESKKINEEDLKNISGGVGLSAKIATVIVSTLAIVPGLALLKRERASTPEIPQTSMGRVRQRLNDDGHERNVKQRCNNYDDERKLGLRLVELANKRENLFSERIKISRQLEDLRGQESYSQQRNELRNKRRDLMSRHDEVMEEFERTRVKLKALQDLR